MNTDKLECANCGGEQFEFVVKEIVVKCTLCRQERSLDEFLKVEPLLEELPHPKIHKLKLFMETFNAVSSTNRNDVNEVIFIDELVKTGKFSKEESKEYIFKAIQNGQIYEKQPGSYAKT